MMKVLDIILIVLAGLLVTAILVALGMFAYWQ